MRFSLLKEMASISDLLKDDSGRSAPIHLPNGVGNLSDTDPIIVAAENLPISPAVRYHSIIGLYKPHGAWRTAATAWCPTPAHTWRARPPKSEVVIPSWHSVQETSAAILELRCIMQRHLQRVDGRRPQAARGS